MDWMMSASKLGCWFQSDHFHCLVGCSLFHQTKSNLDLQVSRYISLQKLKCSTRFCTQLDVFFFPGASMYIYLRLPTKINQMEVNNAIDEWYGIWDDDFLYLIFSLVDLLVSSIEPWSNVHFRFLKFKRATPHKYIQIPICERSESFELTIFSIYMLNFQQKMDPQNPTMGKVAKKFQKPERNMGGCPFCALLKHGRKPGLFLMVYWKSSKTSKLSPTLT